MTELEELTRLANRLADCARAVIREMADASGLRYKADGSPVTDVDLAVEAALRKVLSAEVPDHGILGEEQESFGLDEDYVWVLDPIDGTRQFSCGLMNFGCLIALCRRTIPVIGIIEQPLAQQRCLGIEGASTTLNGRPVKTRACSRMSAVVANLCEPDCIKADTSTGYEAILSATHWNVYDGGCLGFSALAAGRLDLCLYGSNVDPFDICALVPVVEGAGGHITTWTGEPITLTTAQAIIGSGSAEVHAQALDLLRP